MRTKNLMNEVFSTGDWRWGVSETSGSAPNVAFIGVGAMGAPMAACIARSGMTVTVYDSAHERAARVGAEHRCRVAAGLDDLALAEFVVTMLPTGQIVRDLYLREGLAEKLGRGAIAIDMSSSNPTGTRALGAALADFGIVLLDAPVSGGVPRAAEGALTIMMGGDDKKAIERARPVLRTMGDHLFDTGGLGSGHAMKALNNFVAAAGFAACAEALLAGQRFGLDPRRMVEILNVSTGRNFHTDVVLLEHVVGGKFASGFQLGLLAKDVRIAADLARDVGLDAPLVDLVSQRFDFACDVLGYARDHTEAIKAWADTDEED
jgi:3-hydroxyisobutyrate dehydrogenase